jgi:hypothetical protein
MPTPTHTHTQHIHISQHHDADFSSTVRLMCVSERECVCVCFHVCVAFVCFVIVFLMSVCVRVCDDDVFLPDPPRIFLSVF